METEIVSLQLPLVVQHALLAMGSSIAVACVDGPSPAGKIAGVLIAAGVIAILAANWHVVEPKWGHITQAFQKAFDAAAASIATVFADIKVKVIKIYYSEERLITEALKRLDKADNSQHHIQDPEHRWDKIIKGPLTWHSIRKIVEQIMKNGRESKYRTEPDVYKRVLKIAGETVTVTFKKLSDIKWAISDAWVNR